jgi:hypothetical protein
VSWQNVRRMSFIFMIDIVLFAQGNVFFLSQLPHGMGEILVYENIVVKVGAVSFILKPMLNSCKGKKVAVRN